MTLKKPVRKPALHRAERRPEQGGGPRGPAILFRRNSPEGRRENRRLVAVAGPAVGLGVTKPRGFMLTWRVRRLRSQSWIDAMAFDREGPAPASVRPGARRRRRAASIRPPGRPQNAGDLRRPCFGRSSWLRPVASAPCSPDHGGRPSPPRDEKCELTRRVSPVAGSPGGGCSCREAAARGGIGLPLTASKCSPRGRRTGSGLRIAGSPMPSRAEALLAAACDPLEGSRVRRRWPLPEATEPERTCGLARDG